MIRYWLSIIYFAWLGFPSILRIKGDQNLILLSIKKVSKTSKWISPNFQNYQHHLNHQMKRQLKYKLIFHPIIKMVIWKKYSTSHFSNQISGSDKTDQGSFCYGFIWFAFMIMLGQAFAYLVVKVIDGRWTATFTSIIEVHLF